MRTWLSLAWYQASEPPPADIGSEAGFFPDIDSPESPELTPSDRMPPGRAQTHLPFRLGDS